MKRLTLKTIKKINKEVIKFLKLLYLYTIDRNIRLVGPNYIYYTDGHNLSVFFNGDLIIEAKYKSGLLFPLKNKYLELRVLKNILKDIKEMQKTL